MTDSPAPISDSYRCTSCGEEVPAEFDRCWNCGTTRDGRRDADFTPAVATRLCTHCPACGYDLRAGSATGSCPECGKPFAREAVDTAPSDAHAPATSVSSGRISQFALACILAVTSAVLVRVVLTALAAPERERLLSGNLLGKFLLGALVAQAVAIGYCVRVCIVSRRRRGTMLAIATGAIVLAIAIEAARLIEFVDSWPGS